MFHDKGNTYNPLTSSTAHLPSTVIGKAFIGRRLAAMGRRRVRAGSSQSGQGSKGDSGELHFKRVNGRPRAMRLVVFDSELKRKVDACLAGADDEVNREYGADIHAFIYPNFTQICPFIPRWNGTSVKPWTEIRIRTPKTIM